MSRVKTEKCYGDLPYLFNFGYNYHFFALKGFSHKVHYYLSNGDLLSHPWDLQNCQNGPKSPVPPKIYGAEGEAELNGMAIKHVWDFVGKLL